VKSGCRRSEVSVHHLLYVDIKERVRKGRCDLMENADGLTTRQNSGLGLAEAIALLREELNEARATDAKGDLQLPISSMTVELSLTTGWTAGGKAGFKVPFVEVGGEGTRKGDTGHKVTITFQAPTDQDGRPISVADESTVRKG